MNCDKLGLWPIGNLLDGSIAKKNLMLRHVSAQVLGGARIMDKVSGTDDGHAILLSFDFLATMD